MSRSINQWKPLVKVNGEWLPKMKKGKKSLLPIRIAKPTIKPCLFDDGNSLMRLAMNGSIVYAKNVFCPGDRIQFMRVVTHMCDAWLLD